MSSFERKKRPRSPEQVVPPQQHDERQQLMIFPQPLHQPPNGDPNTAAWSVEWTNEHHQAIITAKEDTVIVLQGRGIIENISDHTVEIHGHQLLNKRTRDDTERTTSNNNNNNEHHDDGALLFESASWASCWTTVHMSQGSRIRVTSTAATSDAVVTDQQMSTFAVHSVYDPEARPTVIPASWKTAVDAIVEDYKKFKSRVQDHRNKQSQASFFQQTALESDGDDNNEEDDCQQNKSFRIVVAGAKGVGKSTCLRYCLNRLLKYSDKVAILDADPGQPEYTVPGMLQLTVVRHPSLQPSHRQFLTSSISSSSQDDPPYEIIQSYYFGSVTSSTDPKKYVQCVSGLVDEIRSEKNTDIPVLINLDGWVKGLGFEILTAILSTVTTPTHVIQIAGDSLSKSLDLTEAVVQGRGGDDNNNNTTCLHQCWAYNSVQEKKVACSNSNINGDCSAVQQENEGQQEQLRSSEHSDLVPLTPSIPAAALRSVRLISYFMNADVIGQEVPALWDRVGVCWNGIDDPACEVAHLLAAAKPYIVSMDAVSIRFTSDDLKREIRSDASILDALNGSVVGLCTQECDGDDSPLSVPTVLLPCLGLGIVRAIDRVKRLFFILTPCPADDLQSVNVLTLGSNVHLPLECYFRGVHSDSFLYQSFDARDTDILGATPMKSRNNISRTSRGSGTN